MYEHVKTGCKHIPPSEQPLQFHSGYYLNKPCMTEHMLIMEVDEMKAVFYAVLPDFGKSVTVWEVAGVCLLALVQTATC